MRKGSQGLEIQINRVPVEAHNADGEGVDEGGINFIEDVGGVNNWDVNE